MKKLSIGLLLILLLLTGCGKVPVLENGQEAVVTLSNGNISIDELYAEMKNNYALNTLINMIDYKLLDEKYPSSDEEKDYIKSQLEQLEYSFKNSYYVSYYPNFNSDNNYHLYILYILYADSLFIRQILLSESKIFFDF